MQAPTSLRWSVATVVLLLAVTVGAWWWKASEIVRYESAARTATVDVAGTVIELHIDSRRDDRVMIEYRDPAGNSHAVTFIVDTATVYPVGSSFPLRSAPGSVVVYPTTDDVATPARYAGMWLFLLGLLSPLPIAWLRRLLLWWRASRMPEERITIRLLHVEPRRESSYRGLRVRTIPVLLAKAWVRIEDEHGRRWFQRLMWEPWFADFTGRAYPARGQRIRPDGPMLVTSRQGGRMLWAGGARATAPMAEPVRSGPPRRGGRRASLVLIAIVPATVSALAVNWGAAVITFAYVLGVVMFYGGPPVRTGRRG